MFVLIVKSIGVIRVMSKKSYIAFDLSSKEFEYPTGRSTRLMGSHYSAGLEARKLGYKHYDIDPVCICLLHRQALMRHIKTKSSLKALKSAYWGIRRFIRDKRRGK